MLLTNGQSLQPHMYLKKKRKKKEIMGLSFLRLSSTCTHPTQTAAELCCFCFLTISDRSLLHLPCPCPVLSQCHSMVGYCGSFLTVCLPSFFLFHYLHRNQNDPFKGITLEVVLWVEVPAYKPDDLSLSPRANMVEDNQYRSLT